MYQMCAILSVHNILKSDYKFLDRGILIEIFCDHFPLNATGMIIRNILTDNITRHI